MQRRLERSALILVDIQNDFCPGGALGVREGDQVIDIANRLMPLFPLVVASQDWHPANHSSFKENGGIWPPHCVQNTSGAALHPKLNRAGIGEYFYKAFSTNVEAYSSFDGINNQGRKLDEVLGANQVETIYIAGLATDYCVKETALDGLKNSYTVYVIEDAVRAVDVEEGDGQKALAELLSKGVHIVTSNELIDKSLAASA